MNGIDTEPLNINCIKISQPIGVFYVGSMRARDLCTITQYDFRRLVEETDGFASYLGIQRRLNPQRVKEISKYVGTLDACFPTAVILAIPGVCAEYNETEKCLKLHSYVDESDRKNNIPFDKMAVVLDGQHRIAGLENGEYDGEFEINVSIFIDIDIADQAYIFSTVNLAQTKVNKSLVYDLFDLAKKRSPQKTCHNIAVALDKNEGSPFFEKIMRLGVSTEGRFNETITQATFVQSLLSYISPDPVTDRNLYLRDSKPKPVSREESEKFLFRNMFIEERDLEITDVIWNYFDAVKKRWPSAWGFSGRGLVLNKNNGFKALMRFLRPAYLYLTAPGKVPSTDDFYDIFSKINMSDNDFNTDKFKPGTSGESSLFRQFLDESKIS